MIRDEINNYDPWDPDMDGLEELHGWWCREHMARYAAWKAGQLDPLYWTGVSQERTGLTPGFISLSEFLSKAEELEVKVTDGRLRRWRVWTGKDNPPPISLASKFRW
jgi:hypothetical protein